MCSVVPLAEHVLVRLRHAITGSAASCSLREIIDGMYGFPPTDPRGPTPMRFLPPLLKTDTCSYDDIIRILKMCFSFVGWMCVVVVVFGDGQTVHRLRDARRKWPGTYKPVLIGCGHFHQFGHWEFAKCEAFWWCLVCCCMQELGAPLHPPPSDTQP
jgi:hypothetical protein